MGSAGMKWVLPSPPTPSPSHYRSPRSHLGTGDTDCPPPDQPPSLVHFSWIPPSLFLFSSTATTTTPSSSGFLGCLCSFELCSAVPTLGYVFLLVVLFSLCACGRDCALFPVFCWPCSIHSCVVYRLWILCVCSFNCVLVMHWINR